MCLKSPIYLTQTASNKMIIAFAARWTSHYVWTGATDTIHEGEWAWVGTQQPLRYTNWKPAQPNNLLKNQHCIYFCTSGHDFRWDDWHCYAARLNYICEIIML